jgi:hypothetical protein
MNWRNRGSLIGLWALTACAAQQSAPATSSASPSASVPAAGGSGALTAEQIRAVVSEHGHDLRNCHGRAKGMTNETFKGDITFQWKIAPSGDVTEVSAVNPPPMAEILAKCVADAIKTRKFPPASGPSSVNRPFSF